MANTTLYTTADATVYEGSPDTNYGGAANIIVSTLIDGNRRVFLKFDLSGLPAGAAITLATLKITCYAVANLIGGVTDIRARRVADDSWTELGITWTNQKAMGAIEDTQAPSVGVVELDITSYAQDELAGDETVSVVLTCVHESYDATSRYSAHRSREHNGDDAELYIEYTIPTAHEVTITETLGMVESVTKQFSVKKTVTDLLGMAESITKQFDARKTVTDKLGLLDTTPTKGTFFQTVTDQLGMVDTTTRVKNIFQTVSDILGLSDTIGTKGAFKQAVTDILGMLDTATRHFPLSVTISDILGIRDRLVTKKRRFPLPDLPDHTTRGGAPE